jgi:hypothetical protein
VVASVVAGDKTAQLRLVQWTIVRPCREHGRGFAGALGREELQGLQAVLAERLAVFVRGGAAQRDDERLRGAHVLAEAIPRRLRPGVAAHKLTPFESSKF